MAEHSSFFNSVDGDRVYKAEDFAKYFGSFISNGIFPNPSANLQVISNNDMTVTVKAGLAWINGYFYYLDADTNFIIETADGTLNRIDRVVVHLDTIGRMINVKILKGVIASSPAAPTIQRDADGYDLALADIYIAAGTTNITQVNITDQRQNSDICGIVDSLIKVDSTTLFNQFTDAFNTWFNTIKNTLGSDVAGNLLNMVNDLAGAERTTETVKGNADTIAALAGEGNTKTVKQLDDEVTAHKSDNMHVPYGVASGTNAKTISINPAPTAYTEGMALAFKNVTANTGAVTINVNGLGAKSVLKSNGNALASGNLKANSVYTIRYNGANFILQGEGGEYGTAGPGDVRNTTTIGTENGVVQGTLDLTNLTPDNLRSGVPVGGIIGTAPVIKKLPTSIATMTTDLITGADDNYIYCVNQSNSQIAKKYDYNGNLIATIDLSTIASTGVRNFNRYGILCSNWASEDKIRLYNENKTLLYEVATNYSFVYAFAFGYFYRVLNTFPYNIEIFNTGGTVVATITDAGMSYNYTAMMNIEGILLLSDGTFPSQAFAIRPDSPFTGAKISRAAWCGLTI